MSDDEATADNESRPAVGAPVQPSVRRLPAPTRTPHGFAFGAADVSATASDERGNVWIGIEGKRAKLTVHVTPSGMLRVWMNGMTEARHGSRPLALASTDLLGGCSRSEKE